MSEDIAYQPMHSQESSERTASSWSTLGSDKKNVTVLIFLYVLQGKC